MNISKGLGLSVKDLRPNLGLSRRQTIFFHSRSPPPPTLFPSILLSLPPGFLKVRDTKVHLVFATLLQNMDLVNTTLRFASIFAAGPDPASMEHRWDSVQAQGCSLAACQEHIKKIPSAAIQTRTKSGIHFPSLSHCVCKFRWSCLVLLLGEGELTFWKQSLSVRQPKVFNS